MNAVILQPGQEIQGEYGSRFVVLQWEGEGSYARVYRAQGGTPSSEQRWLLRGDPTRLASTRLLQNGDGAAIKLAKAEVEGAAERLQSEHTVHRQVGHPAIPALLDTGEIAGVPWLALRWVSGETLRRRLERSRGLALVQAVPVLMRVADAVASLHAAGWSHGDPRPDNVLLESGTGQAFLLDLGEARPLGGVRRPATGVRRSAGRIPAPAETSLLPHDRDAVGDDSRRHDLRRLGELMAWSLTGIDPTVEPERLSRAGGYHPAAVQLWHESRDGRLDSASRFRDALQRLARQLDLK